MTTEKNTLIELLKNRSGDKVAFSAPNQSDLSYSGLIELIEETAAALASAGVERGDKVAIVLPNGPEAATAFLAAAHIAVAAPLNPAYTQDEFAFYLQDLGAKLVICDDAAGLAAAAAAGLGIRVVSIERKASAGQFSLKLSGEKNGIATNAGPDDACMVLHTSGTTSRPKIVPLTHRNICASAHNIAATLNLTADDRTVNIMPLFHIHGLIAAVLSSLSAGASIYCTPGFNAMKVFSWFEEAHPTWYTAVPTMHQAILTRAGRNEEVIAGTTLRFIRSSSSSLPPQVMAALEETFRCPVVEAYGMTEAAHQMTSNPIAHGTQKPGSVGSAAGPEVAIYCDGEIGTKADLLGEIVISGDNVTKGYEANEKANAESFIADPDSERTWFRTGDQGRFDADGYLYITGRLKEIINRGGEKISPREVDEILMDHEAVLQAVTFAVPHKQLGEDVAAAVKLKDGCTLEQSELKSFARERLAGFKVPRQIVILDEIPKGPTGKLQRIGLAEKLGLKDAQ
ncbi:acyl--CoA ligase [Hoeflea sp. TYP-13]|uniref:acyl--CoA ligase n=1 Tax=Hoeflea sp. TYP-13 TaxID=3230023 RepID=UPI0034C61A5A